jgi:NADH dehydrogenase [ubiquinone] 1 alpha subcomplex assembly factor 1
MRRLLTFINFQIPFSKFVFGSKGRVQDMQNRIPLDRIASFGLAVGGTDGPFSLEIDWIGVECDMSNQEEFAYEMYKIPPFIANV